MAATTTTLSTLVRPVVSETDATIVKYTNRQFFQVMRAIGLQENIPMSMGDSAFRWKVIRGTGNSSVETYSEGQAAAASGSQSVVEAASSYIYFRVVAELTGHAADQLKSHYLGTDYAPQALGGEIKNGIDDLDDLAATTFLGTGASGLELAIDAAGTYSGLSRTTYSDWGSEENAVSGVLTVASMTLLHEELEDNDRGATVTACLMPRNQLTNYAALVGAENGTAADRLVRYVSQGGAPQLDVGFMTTGLTINGTPIYGVQDMTDTVVAMLDTTDRNGWAYITQRPIQIADKTAGSNSDAYAVKHVTMASTMVCRNPRKQGKLTAVTA